MINFKKKFLAGVLSGALMIAGTNALAAPNDYDADAEKSWEEEAAANRGGWAKYFAEKYGVEASAVEQAFNDGVHIEDIRSAAVLSKLSGRNFSDVLSMKVDWPQVAEQLGVTREQMKKFFEQERDEHFARRAGLDVNAYRNLLKDGYHPHDIDMAARIAKAANKNIKSVLDKREINNTWDDVAKSFGVDMKKIMPPPPGHHRDGEQRRHHRDK